MLRNIPTESKEYARQMLAILCCAVRPLTVPELIEYLESERIHAQKDSSSFSVQKREANGLMAVVCLTLLHIGTTNPYYRAFNRPKPISACGIRCPILASPLPGLCSRRIG
ncbi:hypothetical protein LY76DRAFT_24677 [Colletotrichum caudatum]|nr:hypothetical protein LY76DRAFT_24677 [Colletotrichum caudatum]